MKSGSGNGRRSFRIAMPVVLQRRNSACKIISTKNHFTIGSVLSAGRRLRPASYRQQPILLSKQHLWNCLHQNGSTGQERHIRINQSSFMISRRHVPQKIFRCLKRTERKAEEKCEDHSGTPGTPADCRHLPSG